jgi:hypothetical protein
MAKIAISIGWKKYVLDSADAVKLAEILGKAEMYDTKYTSNSEGGNTMLHYVYPQEEEKFLMEILPDNLYRMAKLAGKPQE